MITGILFCLSLIPTAVSTQASPAPLKDVRIDVRALYANSPLACAACLLCGVANGAFGTLGAVYGARIGISTGEIALMMSITVVAGAALQLPSAGVGPHGPPLRASRGNRDLLDRRSGHLLRRAADGFWVLTLTAAYGAFAYTIYSVAVAHANDHARPEDFVTVSSGLLMLYGFGTMAGPVIAAILMARLRPESLFLATALAHVALAAYTVLRIRQRAPVPVGERETFQTLPAERAVTPQAILLDPRSGDQDVPDAQADASRVLTKGEWQAASDPFSRLRRWATLRHVAADRRLRRHCRRQPALHPGRASPRAEDRQRALRRIADLASGVSQHLKALLDSCLVEVRAEGTRRIYSVIRRDSDGLISGSINSGKAETLGEEAGCEAVHARRSSNAKVRGGGSFDRRAGERWQGCPANRSIRSDAGLQSRIRFVHSCAAG